MNYIRFACIIALLILPSCAPNMERKVDEQGKAIMLLQQKTQELDRSLRRLQADYHSELDKISVELQAMKGTIEESSHRTDKALADINSSLGKMPGSVREDQQQIESFTGEPSAPLTSGTEKPPVRTAPAAPTGEKEMYNHAYSLFTNGEFEKARKAFQEMLKVHPGSGLTDSAMYWIANSYFKEKKFEEAISACDDVIKKFPQGNKTPDAYYLQALAFCEIKDPLTAQILLETLIQNFPNAEAASLGKKKYEELKGKTAQ